MQAERQTDIANADAVSDEQPAVVEPGQPPAKRLKTAAATAQPCEPRYVVPPATSDLAFGSSHWDGKPAEIHAMILKHAGLLTRFLCGLLGDTDTLDEATKRQLWIEAFKMDWQGDLDLLPDVDLSANNGLLLAHSRSMYDRLCKRFPQHTEPLDKELQAMYNSYDVSFFDGHFDNRRLMFIPMRHGWLDLLDFTYPIALARIAIRFGFVDLLKHLDDKYKTLQHWTAKRDPTSDYWCDAVDPAASRGHLGVVQYLFEAGVTGCTTRAMDWAAENDHLHVVVWLHENTIAGCTTAAMDGAAGNGRLHVVKWLHANRTEGCTANAMNGAASNGHLHVVQWLPDEAIKHGQVDAVKYMHSKGGRASSNAVETTARWGSIEMVQYLVDCGYAVELGALKCAWNATIVNILLGSLTLDQAQALLAEANRGNGTKTTTIRRLKSTIKKLQTSSK